MPLKPTLLTTPVGAFLVGAHPPVVPAKAGTHPEPSPHMSCQTQQGRAEESRPTPSRYSLVGALPR